MAKTADLKMLFGSLITQFGFGKISAFKATNITKRIPKYSTVKISEIDLNERRLYSGPYSGYSDEELIEVLDTELFFPDREAREKYAVLYTGREDLITNGKLIHYQQVDQKLNLPPGTAKRLLKVAAARYGLSTEYERDNVIRFKRARI